MKRGPEGFARVATLYETYFKRESAREECLETYPTSKTAGGSQRSLENKENEIREVSPGVQC